MWSNPQLRIWSHLLKKYLIENFIFLCSGVGHVTCISKGLETKFLDLDLETNILRKDQ